MSRRCVAEGAGLIRISEALGWTTSVTGDIHCAAVHPGHSGQPQLGRQGGSFTIIQIVVIKLMPELMHQRHDVVGVDVISLRASMIRYGQIGTVALAYPHDTGRAGDGQTRAFSLCPPPGRACEGCG